MTVPSGEQPELNFMRGFQKIPEMVGRIRDFDVRLKEMNDSGTSFSVLSLNPPGVQMHDKERGVSFAREMNDGLVEIIKRWPARFAGIGGLVPQDPDRAALELKRIMGPLGLGGVIINSHTHGHYLDEPQFEPILAAAEEENATIYLHPRVPSPQMLGPYSNYGLLAAMWGFQAEAGTHAMRMILSGVFDRHPKLSIVLGHLGEGLPFWMWRLDNMYKRTFGWSGEKLGMVKLQLKPSEYLRRNFAAWMTRMRLCSASRSLGRRTSCLRSTTPTRTVLRRWTS
jgi:5-carboxyvanillate decarboxylase